MEPVIIGGGIILLIMAMRTQAFWQLAFFVAMIASLGLTISSIASGMIIMAIGYGVLTWASGIMLSVLVDKTIY